MAMADVALPEIFASAGENASMRFIEFFAARIRNANTRQAYLTAVFQFAAWCEESGLTLAMLRPVVVGTYIEWLSQRRSAPTVKQHLAAIRMLFDELVIGQVCPTNPCHGVRGPRHVIRKGKTPVLSPAQARQLLDSIPCDSLIGLRDRALIATMVYSFARVGAVVKMGVDDYWQNGKRWWFRLHEKGGRHHEVPAHHTAEAYLDAYLAAAGIAGELKSPLFRTIPAWSGTVSANPMSRRDVLAMIKRRASIAGLPHRTSCHTFRATGITAYLSNGGTLEKAQNIAAHASPRTTMLYDRRSDDISLDEIERIVI
jgi:integrase/recombinase XerD